jgi:hypothetical protein
VYYRYSYNLVNLRPRHLKSVFIYNELNRSPTEEPQVIYKTVGSPKLFFKYWTEHGAESEYYQVVKEFKMASEQEKLYSLYIIW